MFALMEPTAAPLNWRCLHGGRVRQCEVCADVTRRSEDIGLSPDPFPQRYRQALPHLYCTQARLPES